MGQGDCEAEGPCPHQLLRSSPRINWFRRQCGAFQGLVLAAGRPPSIGLPVLAPDLIAIRLTYLTDQEFSYCSYICMAATRTLGPFLLSQAFTLHGQCCPRTYKRPIWLRNLCNSTVTRWVTCARTVSWYGKLTLVPIAGIHAMGRSYDVLLFRFAGFWMPEISIMWYLPTNWK